MVTSDIVFRTTGAKAIETLKELNDKLLETKKDLIKTGKEDWDYLEPKLVTVTLKQIFKPLGIDIEDGEKYRVYGITSVDKNNYFNILIDSNEIFTEHLINSLDKLISNLKGIEYVYISEEPEKEIYINTDKKGYNFPQRYLVKNKNDPSITWFHNQIEVMDYINKYFSNIKIIQYRYK